MAQINRLATFRIWCNKILPLVYDDSLSYYEVLCKTVDYVNKLVDNDKIIGDELADLRNDLTVVQKWIDDYDTTFAREIIEEYLAKMIIVGINDSGYIVYYIPETWDDIQFNTTGLDITVPGVEEYGRLVLSY